MTTYYSDYFDYTTPVGDYCLGHGNGAGVSLMFAWNGDQDEFYDDNEFEDLARQRLNLLKNIKHDLHVEHHFFRNRSDKKIDEYLEHGRKIIRDRELAEQFRQVHADHLRPHSFSNRVYTILRLNTAKGLKGKDSRNIYKRWDAMNKTLLKEFESLRGFYPGAQLLTKEEYIKEISLTANPEDTEDRLLNLDYAYDLSEQIYFEKPALDEGYLKIGNTYLAHALIYNNPQMDMDWFLNFAVNTDCGVHITQILQRLDRGVALDRAASKSRRTAETADNTKGKYETAHAVGDIEAYQETVSMNDYEIYKNAFIFQFISTDVTVLDNTIRSVRNAVEENGGRLESGKSIQYHLYRITQPGQGANSKFFREDYSLVIAAMMPFTVFNTGKAAPECIRLTSSGEVIGYSPSKFTVGHEILVAKTGGGKGTQMGVEVLETYPFGLDYYILEYGDTFKWVVESYGGSYHRLNPDVCLNPLPDYSQRIEETKDDKTNYLPKAQIAGTVDALAFILLDGVRDLAMAERAVAENGLNELYRIKKDIPAPTLPMLLETYEKLDVSNDQQKTAKQLICNNLYNFLDTKTGEPFRGQDNLKLHDHLCGVDMIAVPESMTKFYLTFVALKYAHKAFFTLERVAKVVLDELHMPMKIVPEITSNLVSAINRMGRKEGAQAGLSTQGLAEITKIDEEVISSSPIRTLLVRDDQWDEIARRLDIPAGVLARWRNFDRNLDELPYRQGIRHLPSGWHDLFLTFPDLFLDITTTTRHERVIKREVEALTNDPIQRVRLLRDRRTAYEKAS